MGGGGARTMGCGIQEASLALARGIRGEGNSSLPGKGEAGNQRGISWSGD